MNDILFDKDTVAGVQFIAVPGDQFKTTRLTAVMLMPLDAHQAAARAMLPSLLARSMKKYPDLTALNRHLAELYGARIFADVQKLGESQALMVSVAAIDERYALENERLFDECARLLCDAIFDPNMENGLFLQQDFEQEKRLLCEQIEGELNDKRGYAKDKAIAHMCEGEPYAVGRLGSLKQARALTLQAVSDCYKETIARCHFVVLAMGQSDPSTLFVPFQHALKEIKRNPIDEIVTGQNNQVDEVRRVVERMQVAQTKLVLGFRCEAEGAEQKAAAKLAAAVFGGTPHSLIFLNVREKLSLCYYCTARYEKLKSIMLVDSGVEKENIQKAEDEILRQLAVLQKGDFSDEALGHAKLALKNSYLSVSDSQGGLAGYYLGQCFDESMKTPAEAADEIDGIDRNAVIEAAKRFRLDTVYMLTGEEQA